MEEGNAEESNGIQGTPSERLQDKAYHDFIDG